MAFFPQTTLDPTVPHHAERDGYSVFRRSLVVILTVLAASCGKASAPPTGPPQIHFDQTTLDLGEIAVRQEPYRAEFQLTNRGFEPLQINFLEKTCSCLDADVSKTEIAPAESGTVTIDVAANKAGEKQTHVVVHSNDQRRRQVRLNVSWRAVAPIEFEPLRLDFGVVRPGSTAERTISVRRHNHSPENPCQLLDVQAVNRELVLTDLSTPPAAFESVQVKLTAGAESGRHTGIIRATLEGCWTDKISLPVEWTVRDVIETAPQQLMLGFGSPGETLHKQIIVSCDPGQVLEISAATMSELSWVTTTTQQLADSLIKVDVAASLPEETDTYEGQLQIQCTAPEPRTFVVPVTAMVR